MSLHHPQPQPPSAAQQPYRPTLQDAAPNLQTHAFMYVYSARITLCTHPCLRHVQTSAIGMAKSHAYQHAHTITNPRARPHGQESCRGSRSAARWRTLRALQCVYTHTHTHIHTHTHKHTHKHNSIAQGFLRIYLSIYTHTCINMHEATAMECQRSSWSGATCTRPPSRALFSTRTLHKSPTPYTFTHTRIPHALSPTPTLHSTHT